MSVVHTVFSAECKHTHTFTNSVIHGGASLINNLLSGERGRKGGRVRERKTDRTREEKKETNEDSENVSTFIKSMQRAT